MHNSFIIELIKSESERVIIHENTHAEQRGCFKGVFIGVRRNHVQKAGCGFLPFAVYNILLYCVETMAQM